MASSKVIAKTASELLSLADRNQIEQLKEGLSLLHGWGIRDLSNLPLLGKLLSHEDPEVVQLSLRILLNYERSPANEFLLLRKYLPVFQQLLGTQPLALDLIVGLCGPTQDLVPHLKTYFSRFPEDACDLIFRFGPLAKDLVPDLIWLLDKNDWDQAWAVVDALGAIGPAAKAAVPLLKELTKHKSGIITGRACVALENITGIPRDHWPRGPSGS